MAGAFTSAEAATRPRRRGTHCVSAGPPLHCVGAVPPPMAGTHAGDTHWNPGLQSALLWQGHAHRPTCVLQRCERHVASVWQGNAMAAGVDMVPVVVGAGCG